MPTANEIIQIFPDTLAVVAIWREARGESFDAKVGVGNVLRNRLADPRWPQNMDEVVLQPLQFSSFNKTDWNTTKFPSRSKKLEWAAFEECAKAYEESGMNDVVGGANHYHDISIPIPGWALNMKKTVQLGKLVFYKG